MCSGRSRTTVLSSQLRRPPTAPTTLSPTPSTRSLTDSCLFFASTSKQDQWRKPNCSVTSHIGCPASSKAITASQAMASRRATWSCPLATVMPPTPLPAPKSDAGRHPCYSKLLINVFAGSHVRDFVRSYSSHMFTYSVFKNWGCPVRQQQLESWINTHRCTLTMQNRLGGAFPRD